MPVNFIVMHSSFESRKLNQTPSFASPLAPPPAHFSFARQNFVCVSNETSPVISSIGLRSVSTGYRNAEGTSHGLGSSGRSVNRLFNAFQSPSSARRCE